MINQRLINYIKEDLKSHNKGEIKKILVEQGYPEELADNAIKAAIETNKQEKEYKRKEKKGIKELEEERESKKEQLNTKAEESKKKLEGLKKKTIEKSRKNSKALIPILIIIILITSFFVFRGIFDGMFYNTAIGTSNRFLCKIIGNPEIKGDCYQKMARNIKIGLVTGLNGLGDKSFNDMAYNALLNSKERYKIRFNILEPKNDEETEKDLRNFSKQKFDLIISMGFNSVEAVNNIATEFPGIKFVIIDGVVKKPNVASLIFKEEEGSYLAGIMAGMMTKSNKIGFIGGLNIPIIKKFEAGFSAGVKSVNTNASVIPKYLFSNDMAGFNSPEKGKENAIELYNKGVDIIYHAAGLSGNGIIEAAKEKDKYVIGVDFDQDYMAKGNVLTSVVKRVDTMVLTIINQTINEEFKGGVYEFGLSDGGISLTQFEYTKEVIPTEVIKRIEKVEEDIKNKKIKVLLD